MAGRIKIKTVDINNDFELGKVNDSFQEKTRVFPALTRIRKADKEKFAIRMMDRKDLDDASIQTEIDILSKVQHPHIVSLYDVYQSKEKLYLVMELLTGGELYDRIVEKGSFTEKDASKVIATIGRAIKLLHDLGIAHRDLKPENLLYATEGPDAEIKLTDFGLSKMFKEDQAMKTICGSPLYVAPEVLASKGYDLAVDLWSLGVILYVLLCGFPPFYSDNEAVLFKQIMKGEFDFPDPEWTEITPAAKELVRKLLEVDPKKRLTADQMLKHPWIAQADIASPRPLAVASTLRQFRAKQKFKAAAKGIMAAQKFAMLGLGKKI
eukprot:tig00001030_g6452.t1